ncbi:hypothetical protein Tcan_04762 [Toxocara canis]|uniref:Uncharacterized protein n=1 Tax=Toxocara canis TaxID=6265 RepID=A0A0B2W635_TOXCA|nr:hypothetical protein Tcan_04762 [Toxocara canis]
MTLQMAEPSGATLVEKRKDSTEEKKKKTWLQVRDSLKLPRIKIAITEASIFSPANISNYHATKFLLLSDAIFIENH